MGSKIGACFLCVVNEKAPEPRFESKYELKKIDMDYFIED
ncbi:hypothetical protein M902_2348 [Bacteriovorax sp. BAL6_X]|nr:hypothetical protein M902_2348 [Bacteriovorax sp. BAL6_X]